MINFSIAKPAWSIPRLCDDFDLSRSKVYELIAEGTLTARKEGAKTLVDGESVRAWYESLPAAAVKPRAVQEAEVAQ